MNYLGFTISHDFDGYWRGHLGDRQVCWARRFKDCKRLINELIPELIAR